MQTCDMMRCILNTHTHTNTQISIQWRLCDEGQGWNLDSVGMKMRNVYLKTVTCCVYNQLPLHGDGNDDDDEDVSKHSSHRLVPVRFFCDLAPFSPFCFLLCRGRTTGNHFSGRSLRTVILSSLIVSVYVIFAVSLTDDRRISARTRGWKLRSQLRRSWTDRAPSRPCPSVSASPKQTRARTHTQTRTCTDLVRPSRYSLSLLLPQKHWGHFFFSN